MFTVHRKLFRIKTIAADSNVFSLAILYENQLLHNPSLLRSAKSSFFVNLCSVVSAESSNESTMSRENRRNSEKEMDRRKSYTVSYLINSCGLSPDKAISASEKVRFRNPEKPNLVLKMLKDHGFSDTQIANLVRKRPRILVCKEKTLLPKLDFFQSIGFPKTQFLTAMSRDPTLLHRSLENQIIPSYNFLKSVLLTDERVASAMKRALWVFLEDPKKSIAPNIAVLRKHGVPNSCILLLLTHYTETFLRKPNKFEEYVKKVLEMGFNPLRSVFVLALHVVSGSRMTWNRSYEAYSNWGWSKDDIYAAFRKHPNCMILSQKKISRTMDFLVNKMGLDSQILATCPTVLFLNLENRIVPRCSVFQVLLSRGLIIKEVKINTLLLPKDSHFLKRFVTKYEKEVPELHDIFKGKVSIQ